MEEAEPTSTSVPGLQVAASSLAVSSLQADGPADPQRLQEQQLEEQRLAVLARYRLEENVLLVEAAFERLVAMAARLFSVPTAMITFFGEGWQWWGAS